MNPPLIEFCTDEANFAFDVNKQYTNILINCDELGWAIYMPTDEVGKYDNKIETGRYYAETTEAYALECNGWYCDSVTKKALQYKLITEEDTKYQLKAPLPLKRTNSKQFVLDVYENLNALNKQLMNTLVY